MALLRPAVPAPAHQSGSVAFNLAGMLLLALLVALGAAYLLDQQTRDKRTPAGNSTLSAVFRTISGHELAIPAHWLHHGVDTADAFASQIDLSLTMAIAGLDEPSEIQIALMPRSQVRSGAAMLDAVYLHQFANETVGGIPGLVGKPLRPGGGLSGETVWYDPLAPNPFVAKCLAPIIAGTGGTCLRAIVLPSGIGAVVTFDANVLMAWRQFDAEIARLMAAIGAL